MVKRINAIKAGEGLNAHLLQWEELKATPVWQIPFHDFGIGPIPSSLKLFDSGHTPNQHRTHHMQSVYTAFN